jgi:hypothetical protein
MKNIFLILVFILTIGSVSAQENRYQDAMSDAIERLHTASGSEEYFTSANIFDRIAIAEKDLWLPYYYGSYACVLMCYNEADNSKKDAILDRAQQLLDSAFAITTNESELHVLQAFLYPFRIMVDPMARGMVYMEKCFQSLETAKSLDSENPRIYFLLGINKLNLPRSMGGGPEIAKPLFEVAAMKFKTFKPENALMPDWGEEINRTELEKLL